MNRPVAVAASAMPGPTVIGCALPVDATGRSVMIPRALSMIIPFAPVPTWMFGAAVMSTGIEMSIVGPVFQSGTTSLAPAGSEPCSAPVLGSSAAHEVDGSLSCTRCGVEPTASISPSLVHRTLQPGPTVKNRGRALSAAPALRGSRGTLMIAGRDTAREYAMPLLGNDAARSVAVSTPVSLESLTHIESGMSGDSPCDRLYALPYAIALQSGAGDTSHTLSTCS